MKNTCTHCQKEFSGREGTRFCSVPCKNAFNNERRRKAVTLTAEIDKVLHRNHEILTALCEKEQGTKLFFKKEDMIKAGFNFERITGVYMNTQGKQYHHVYNYAWMSFSSGQVMVIVK